MTRNCLNALRKVASLSKNADEHPGYWKIPGLQWANSVGKNIGKFFGINYEDTPDGYQRNRPSRSDVLAFLQRQRDNGGRWRTPEGMNSQALMAGSDAHDGNVYARQRAVEQRYIDSMRRRQKALQTLVAEEPEYSPAKIDYNTRAKQLWEAADNWQKDIDASREERMAEGRKLFFDQGGRWSIQR